MKQGDALVSSWCLLNEILDIHSEPIIYKRYFRGPWSSKDDHRLQSLLLALIREPITNKHFNMIQLLYSGMRITYVKYPAQMLSTEELLSSACPSVGVRESFTEKLCVLEGVGIFQAGSGRPQRGAGERLTARSLGGGKALTCSICSFPWPKLSRYHRDVTEQSRD